MSTRLLALAVLAVPLNAGAQMLTSGDIVVTANTTFNPCPGTGTPSQPGVYAVGPLTGDTSLITGEDSQTGATRGTGARLDFPLDAVTSPAASLFDGDAYLGPVYVIDRSSLPPSAACGNPPNEPAVIGVDPATGDRWVVSGRGEGSGPALRQPQALAMSPDGTTLVVADDIYMLFVDLDTGERTQIVGYPDVYIPQDVQYTSDGTLYALGVDFGLGCCNDKTVWRIDPDGAGGWTPVPILGAGTPFSFRDGRQVAIDPTGKMFVAAQVSDLLVGWHVLQADVTGVTPPSVFTSNAIPGPFLGPIRAVGLEPTGRLLASGAGGSLLRVDATGQRIVVAGGFGLNNPGGGAGALWSAHVVGNEPVLVPHGPNSPPVADAGMPVVVGTDAFLDGTASYDPEGDPIAFSWTASDGVFDDPTSPTPVLNASPGIHTVTLTVSDGWPDIDTVQVEITEILNEPPIADAGEDDDVACVDGGADYTLDGTGSTDPDDDPLTYLWTGSFGTATGPMPTVFLDGLGDHPVSLVVDDGYDGTDMDDVTIGVFDDAAPELSVVDAVVALQCQDLAGTMWELAAPVATDTCDATVTVESDAPGTYPPGSTTVTFTATDDAGNTATISSEVIVTYDVYGFHPPMDALVPAEVDIVPMPDKAFKLGRTLPLKLGLACGDTTLTDAEVTPPFIVALERDGEAIDLEVTDLDAGNSNDGGIAFRWTDEHWAYNLKTSNLQTGTWRITIQSPDGARWASGFVLR